MNPTNHIDLHNPLNIIASDSPSQALVTKLFDGTSFQSWKRSVKIAPSARNKLGLVNGDIQKPRHDEEGYRSWERANDMVVSWLLNSVERDIADSLLYCNSARELWIELESRFDQGNGNRCFNYRRN